VSSSGEKYAGLYTIIYKVFYPKVGATILKVRVQNMAGYPHFYKYSKQMPVFSTLKMKFTVWLSH